MMDLPDAPWIREAEMYGPPGVAEEIDYCCPVCGEEQPEDFYFDNSGEIVGCSCCLCRKDAYEYMADKKANETPDVW